VLKSPTVYVVAAGVIAAVTYILTHQGEHKEQKPKAVMASIDQTKPSELKISESLSSAPIIEIIRRLHTCLEHAVPEQTALGHFGDVHTMINAGVISGDKRYLVRSGAFEPHILQLEVTDRNKERRAQGHIYRDIEPDGNLDEVRKGSTLQRSTAAEITSKSQDEYKNGLQIVTQACEQRELDLSIFDGVDAKNLSPSELYELLQKSAYFYPTKFIPSQDPDAKTILLIGENHLDALVGWRELDILREKLGIDLVELEGWCGKDADDKRGVEVFNADTRLIRKLIDSKHFQMVGLEQEDFQTAQKLFVLKQVSEGFQQEKNRNPGCSSDPTPRVQCADYGNYILDLNAATDNLHKLGYKDEELSPDLIHGNIERIAKKYNMSFEEFAQNLPMALREKVALERIDQSMKDNDARFRSVIFGLFHIPTLTKSLQKRGYNIIVLEDPFEYDHLDFSK